MKATVFRRILMKFHKNTQLGRSILSKCGVDKQMFLSDVYKKRTQAKKHQLDAPQFGRSMVEMLGVLAIIGVLSVGGIAGYSKAMAKYKLNKTINQISTISQGIRSLCLNGTHQCKGLYCIYNTSAPPLKDGCKMLKSLNLIPEEMWKEDTNDIIHPYGGGVQVDYGAENYGLQIRYYNLPNDACVSIASIDWATTASGVTQIIVGGNGETSTTGYSKDYAAKNNITLTRENSIPLPVDAIAGICSNNNQKYNIIIG
jgi:type II secretory pathway pseudopilin PulG